MCIFIYRRFREMSRIDIPFVVEKQHITQPTRATLVSGGKTYFYATFTISEVWDDISNIKAVFLRDDVSKLIGLIKTESGFECEIPWEVMANKGSFQVGIFGGNRMLTDYAYVIVKQGCITNGTSPTPPTPDWFDTIEKEIEKVEDYVDEQTEIIKSDIEGIRTRINDESHFRGYLSTNDKIQSLVATPNDFAYSAESGTVWIYDEVDGWVDSGETVPDQSTPASDATPLINGTASAGTENAYARGDHRHPTDTTRASAAEVNELKRTIETSLDHIIDIQNNLMGVSE